MLSDYRGREGNAAAAKKLNSTQQKLAEQLGVHVMTVSKWERGVVEIPQATALALRFLVMKKSDKGK